MSASYGLNEAQQEAVTHNGPALCILAGAGTGKTRVITHRIAHFIQSQNILPSQIMAVTFTNKAAQEMKKRLERMIPEDFWRIQMGTFHGISARYLRRMGDLIDVDPNFVIYDQSDSERILKRLAKERLGLEKDDMPPLFRLIDEWQNQGLMPADVTVENQMVVQQAHQLYGWYLEALKAAKAVDFNGLLLGFRDLLHHPECEAALAGRLKHLLVDEYQDTNTVQAQIVLQLAKIVDSVTVVGDDDQTIYGWRGASANHLQQFMDSLDGSKLIKLEENYRSKENILNAANGVIDRNPSRLGKSLYAKSGAGDQIYFFQSLNDLEEAQRAIHIIDGSIRDGIPLSEIAILMRTNAQSRLFEEALRRHRLPYVMLGGIKFFDRKEVKDLLAMVRLGLNTGSDVDLHRVLQAKPWGVGAGSIAKAQLFGSQHGIGLFDVLISAENLSACGMAKRSKSMAYDFAKKIADLNEALHIAGDLANPIDASDAVDMALEASGFIRHFKDKLGDEAEQKIDNLEQLRQSAQNFVRFARVADTPADIRTFLEEAALMSNTEDLSSGRPREDGDVSQEERLMLMTMHAAKGLEFEVVIMVGMEERVFPHSRALDDYDPNAVEEERRLAYVGITRAKTKLYMTCAKRRMFQGTVQSRHPSRFLKEIPVALMTGDINSLHARPQAGGMWGQAEDAEWHRQSPKAQRSGQLGKGEDLTQTNTNGYKPGMSVAHKIFGSGRIMALKGSGSLLRADVLFDKDHSRRTIIAKFLDCQ